MNKWGWDGDGGDGRDGSDEVMAMVLESHVFAYSSIYKIVSISSVADMFCEEMLLCKRWISISNLWNK